MIYHLMHLDPSNGFDVLLFLFMTIWGIFVPLVFLVIYLVKKL